MNASIITLLSTILSVLTGRWHIKHPSNLKRYIKRGKEGRPNWTKGSKAAFFGFSPRV